MSTTGTPVRLWCFCFEYAADILSLCATGRYELQERTPYETVLNYTPDISEYVSYSWFQWCYYFDEGQKTKSLCRWLGPTNGIVQSFCSYILLENVNFIARSSVLAIPDSDLNSSEIKTQMEKFMTNVETKIGNSKLPVYDREHPNKIYYDLFIDDYDYDDVVLPYGHELIDTVPSEINEPYLESLDNYLGAKVVLPGKDSLPVLATIKKRKRDAQGNLIGEENNNPILDTRIYELEYPDSRIEEFGVNTITENLMEQVDEYGWDSDMLKEIVGYRFDPTVAIQPGDDAFTELNGIKRPVITTKGWDIQVRWDDNSTSWLPLSTINESNPIQLAEYAVANDLIREPAFRWWVFKVPKKRDRIINKARRCRKNKMKFGVEVPSMVQEALALDEKNGNHLWEEAIKKEMKNSRMAFKLLGTDEKPPVGFAEITCHLVFDVKMDLTRKARYVAGGHLTDPPSSMTYASVVSWDSVRIAFLIAALNDLNILAGDIQNAYLHAGTKEKLFFYAGDEWKSDKDKVVVIVRALYGLKSSALMWRNHLAEVLGNHTGFRSSLADPYVWMKPEIDQNGFKYYSYILVYVDDILILDKLPEKYMNMIQEKFPVKKSSIEEPKIYLGANIGKVSYPDGSIAWTMSSDSYVKEAVRNVKARMKEDNFRFNKKLSDINYSPDNPFSAAGYRPELDLSAECTVDQITYYQNLIGVLRWIVELGRIDIGFEVSTLSRFLVNPRTGHLQQTLHIFKYLETHNSNDLAFDPLYLLVENDGVIRNRNESMRALYPDAIEDLPPNAPESRGNSVQINCFVDSDHAGDRMTRRSQSGIILYCNSAPIVWHSKRQNTAESSTFGSEFVALRVATELISSLRYKLRMFGIPIDGPANVFCDNESVWKNATLAESQLKKKHLSICFHRVRECVASQIIVPHKVGTDSNLADILTKSLPPDKRIALRSRIMFSGG